MRYLWPWSDSCGSFTNNSVCRLGSGVAYSTSRVAFSPAPPPSNDVCPGATRTRHLNYLSRFSDADDTLGAGRSRHKRSMD
jgi:hypothetical protein